MVQTVILLLVPTTIAAVFCALTTAIVCRVFAIKLAGAPIIALCCAMFGVCAGLLGGVNRGTIVGAAIPAFITLPISVSAFFVARKQLLEPLSRTLVVLLSLAISVSFGFFYGSASMARWELLSFDTKIFQKEVELALRIKEAAAMKIVETGQPSNEIVTQLVAENDTSKYRFGNSSRSCTP